jgi:hypothetical protein
VSFHSYKYPSCPLPPNTGTKGQNSFDSTEFLFQAADVAGTKDNVMASVKFTNELL